MWSDSSLERDKFCVSIRSIRLQKRFYDFDLLLSTLMFAGLHVKSGSELSARYLYPVLNFIQW